MLNTRLDFQLVSPRLIFWLFFPLSLVLLLWSITHWSLHFLSPRGEARPVLSLPDPNSAAQKISSRHLFGKLDKSMIAPMTSPAESNAIRVLGIASSGRSGNGFAILSIEGKPSIPAVEGLEFSPGYRLISVTTTGIEYERNGARHRANLHDKRFQSNAHSGRQGKAQPVTGDRLRGDAAANIPNQIIVPNSQGNLSAPGSQSSSSPTS